MKRTGFALSLLVFLPTLVWSQAAPLKSWKKHEIFLGYGGASSNEKHVFNVQYDTPAKPSGFTNFGYLYHFSPKGALGVQVNGWTQTIPDVWLVDQYGNARSYTFDLFVANLGLQGRLIPVQGTVEPYVYAAVNRTMGSVSNPDAGTLNMSGFSFGFGGGASVFLGSHLTLGAEALGAFGSANYEKKPFGNSSGTDFSPAFFGLTGQISVRF